MKMSEKHLSIPATCGHTNPADPLFFKLFRDNEVAKTNDAAFLLMIVQCIRLEFFFFLTKYLPCDVR